MSSTTVSKMPFSSETTTSSKPKQTHLSRTAVSFVSGGLSAALSKTAGAPLERIKLLYQTRQLNQSFSFVFKDILLNQGVLSFWRGNLSNILRYFPLQSFILTFKDEFKHLPFIKKIKEDNILNNGALLSNITASGLAGGCGLTIVYPLDFTRTTMAYDMTLKNNRLLYTGIYDCLKQNVLRNGIFSIYSGWLPGFSCYFLYRGIQIGAYDTLKVKYNLNIKKKGDLRNESFLKFVKKFSLSFVLTSFSATIVYPLDTIRRKRIVDNKISSIQHLSNIYSQKGFLGLYKGLLVNYGRNLTGAMVIVLYDYFKPALNALIN